MDNRLPGRVEFVSYLGAVLELHVRLSPADRVVVQLPNRGDARRRPSATTSRSAGSAMPEWFLLNNEPERNGGTEHDKQLEILAPRCAGVWASAPSRCRRSCGAAQRRRRARRGRHLGRRLRAAARQEHRGPAAQAEGLRGRAGSGRATLRAAAKMVAEKRLPRGTTDIQGLSAANMYEMNEAGVPRRSTIPSCRTPRTSFRR